MKQFITESQRLQKLAGINEIKIIPSIINSGGSPIPTPQEWESLGREFEVEEQEDGDLWFRTPYGIAFATEPNEPNKLSAEVQYWDYEMNEEEGSEMVEGLIDELKTILQPKGYKVEGVFSNSDCIIYIYR
jgi:hypothetical protein